MKILFLHGRQSVPGWRQTDLFGPECSQREWRQEMKTFVALPIFGILLWASIHAGGQSETTAGWVKHPKNPVLGGDLGTCFDISVLKEGDTYRMWFSWRPKKSIALVESKDGFRWGKPVIVLAPNEKTDWESDLNRPVVLKN